MGAPPSSEPATVPPTADAETSLLEQLRRGEEEAFETLVRTYGPRLLAVARRYLPREADAEDALQDALLNVHRSIASFQGESRLGTWLHRVTVNAALMRIRARNRRPDPSPDSLGWQALAAREGPVWAFSPTEALSRSEVRFRLQDGMARLPEGIRAVVRLRDIEGIDLREIATLLGIGLSTVKSRLHRGRSALRACLNDWGEGPGPS
jgi:RNA polymerase sigma-70 factor (ECF subfamily)